jgi:hypothetical protein
MSIASIAKKIEKALADSKEINEKMLSTKDASPSLELKLLVESLQKDVLVLKTSIDSDIIVGVSKIMSKLDYKDPVTGEERYGTSARTKVLGFQDSVQHLTAFCKVILEEIESIKNNVGDDFLVPDTPGALNEKKAFVPPVAGPLRSMDTDFNRKSAAVGNPPDVEVSVSEDHQSSSSSSISSSSVPVSAEEVAALEERARESRERRAREAEALRAQQEVLAATLQRCVCYLNHVKGEHVAAYANGRQAKKEEDVFGDVDNSPLLQLFDVGCFVVSCSPLLLLFKSLYFLPNNVLLLLLSQPRDSFLLLLLLLCCCCCLQAGNTTVTSSKAQRKAALQTALGILDNIVRRPDDSNARRLRVTHVALKVSAGGYVCVNVCPRRCMRVLFFIYVYAVCLRSTKERFACKCV